MRVQGTRLDRSSKSLLELYSAARPTPQDDIGKMARSTATGLPPCDSPIGLPWCLGPVGRLFWQRIQKARVVY